MKKTRNSAKPLSADAIARLADRARTFPVFQGRGPNGTADSTRERRCHSQYAG